MLMTQSWRACFPALSGISEAVSRLLDDEARPIRISEGTVIFGPGKSAESLLLLLTGTVRVQHRSGSGHRVVLYRVHSGESCVLTTACLLASQDYTAEGIAESDVEAISIPRDVFDDLLATSKEFRAFVFGAYATRITDLFTVVEEIAFKRMDVRIAEKLMALKGDQNTLYLTGQQLSIALGTAREVVSRQLLEFERRGWLRMKHGVIELCDPAAIARLAYAH